MIGQAKSTQQFEFFFMSLVF